MQPCYAALVRRLHYAVIGTYDEALRETGLTTAQLDLLETVAAAGPEIRAIDLAEEMNSDRSTISRAVSRLASKGLLKTVSGRNRRESYLRLTLKGRQAVAKSRDAWLAAQRKTREVLGARGVECLAKLAVSSNELHAERT